MPPLHCFSSIPGLLSTEVAVSTGYCVFLTAQPQQKPLCFWATFKTSSVDVLTHTVLSCLKPLSPAPSPASLARPHHLPLDYGDGDPLSCAAWLSLHCFPIRVIRERRQRRTSVGPIPLNFNPANILDHLGAPT